MAKKSKGKAAAKRGAGKSVGRKGAKAAPEALRDDQPQHPPECDDGEPAGPDADAKENSKADADPGKSEGTLEDLRTERDELKDQLLRALAEVENMRRRTERELEGARKYGHMGFSRDLVGAVDNLARAIDAAPGANDAADAEAVKALVDGLGMSWKEIQATMERHGIRRVNPEGEKFDYNFHQAMFELESADHEPGTVMEVVQHGYVLHDRLLRPAMVGVSKAPAPESEAGDGAAPEE